MVRPAFYETREKMGIIFLRPNLASLAWCGAMPMNLCITARRLVTIK